MNNEPVAWTTDGKEVMRINSDGSGSMIPRGNVIHPVKELTDEAIITVADPLNLWDVPKDKLIEFARAILRKASEK